jgi:hypothetical protein
MAIEESRQVNPAINPLVQELLAEGGGKVLRLGGFVGQTRDGYVRLYADLSLRKYIEIAKADIVRVTETPDNPEQPSIVYFKITRRTEICSRSVLQGRSGRGCDGIDMSRLWRSEQCNRYSRCATNWRGRHAELVRDGLRQ